MQKRIFIPFGDYSATGGPATFMRNLKVFLDERSYLYATSPWLAKSIFFPISYDIKLIRFKKLFGGKIIQRLDGIYYPSKHGSSYKSLNKLIKEIYCQYADFVVFQSEYSLRQCFEVLGKKKVGDYEIIINGADKKIFFPPEKASLYPSKSIRFVTTGNFRHRSMIEPIVEALDILEGKLEFELTVIGPISDHTLKRFLNRSYVRYLGYKKITEIALILQQSDIFIYSHLNPPCPNSVIEAISAGLPVVGFDSGSMSEILHFNKEALVKVSLDLFQDYKDFDKRILADKIIFALENYSEFKKIALANSHLYSFDECGARYMKIFVKYDN